MVSLNCAILWLFLSNCYQGINVFCCVLFVCFVLGKLCVKLLSVGIWLRFLNAIGSNQIIWGRPENNCGLLRLLPWLNSEINTNTLPRDASFTFSPLYFISLPSLPPFAQCQMCAAQKNTSWIGKCISSWCKCQHVTTQTEMRTTSGSYLQKVFWYANNKINGLWLVITMFT